MTGILDGIKVAEMGQYVAIPSAGAMMADWGAEVIRIEPPTGEALRGLRSDQGVDVSSLNLQTEVANRNKKSLAVDLKKEAGRDILYRLVKKSDVFMSNFEVGALKRLKVDYATLSQINPRLVYAFLTGYGSMGPDKDERGFDHTAAWARSGIQHLLGASGFPPPLQPGGMMDRVTATNVVAGVLGALLYRDRTGKGQEIECSLYQSGVWAIARDIQNALAGSPMPRRDRTREANPLWNAYGAKDNRWFTLAMLQADLYWADFCRAIERPELENDPRFNNMGTRRQNCQVLIRLLDEIFASKNRKEWEQRFKDNNCIYGRVETPEEVVSDPQAVANGFFAEVEHPAGGKIKLLTMPVNFRQNPGSVRTVAPELGQHTEEILLGLDYSWEDIARLKEQGVIL
ncbi:MAG: CoA transferase [Chloroflexi bacterium]|nr:CoA transferase [Chloroflexota bacterium]